MDETKQTLCTPSLRRLSVYLPVCPLSAAHFYPAKIPKLGHFVSLQDKLTGH